MARMKRLVLVCSTVLLGLPSLWAQKAEPPAKDLSQGKASAPVVAPAQPAGEASAAKADTAEAPGKAKPGLAAPGSPAGCPLGVPRAAGNLPCAVCRPDCPGFKDANNDGRCDNCPLRYGPRCRFRAAGNLPCAVCRPDCPGFKDANNDGRCDSCPLVGPGRFFIDQNGNGVCDRREALGPCRPCPGPAWGGRGQGRGAGPRGWGRGAGWGPGCRRGPGSW